MFVKDTLAEEGMSSPSEEESEQEEAANPALVMIDEGTGNRYMRIVPAKGLETGVDKKWMIEDIHQELKAWGHPGGEGSKLIIKSDGESPIVTVQ